MKYQNTKTGFVFDFKSEIAGEHWVKLDAPLVVEEKTEEIKPAPKKRTKKNG